VAANVSTTLPYQTPESPLDDSPTGGTQFDGNFMQALAQEMMKLMKKTGGDQQHDSVNSFAHFAGKATVSIGSHLSVCNAVFSDGTSSWIIDTGASDHMTHDSSFFTSTKLLFVPIHVT